MRFLFPVKLLLAGIVLFTGKIGGCKAFFVAQTLPSHYSNAAHGLHKSPRSLLSCGIGSPVLPLEASCLGCCGGGVRWRTYSPDMVLPSASSQQWVRAARRRSSTSLFLNRGAGGGGGGAGGGGGQGSGTQQLSRQAKLAISVLIDLIGMSSFALPGIGEVGVMGVPWGGAARFPACTATDVLTE